MRTQGVPKIEHFLLPDTQVHYLPKKLPYLLFPRTLFLKITSIDTYLLNSGNFSLKGLILVFGKGPMTFRFTTVNIFVKMVEFCDDTN